MTGHSQKPPLALYNPLPRALRHYEAALRATSSQTLPPALSSAGVEAAGQGRLARGKLLAQHLQALSDPGTPLMVLWPGLGHLDAAVLSRRRAPAALVFHDPDPLRPAFGYGKFSRLLATTRQRVTVIAHSLLAEQRLREIGYRTLMIPHPVLRAADTAQAPSCPVVRVLGQYKPVRDTDILVGLGERLVKRGIRAEIVGRGWPRLPGWDVRDEFVGEDEFDQLVRNTSAVVLPYQRYWQSGVALRALEHAVPVVGVDHGFLREVLGQGAPGLVSRDQRAQPEAWIDAIHCTLATEREYYADRLDSYAAQGRDALDAVVVSLAR